MYKIAVMGDADSVLEPGPGAGGLPVDSRRRATWPLHHCSQRNYAINDDSWP